MGRQVTTAALQTSLPEDRVLHSTNAGAVVHRTAQLIARHRRAGRRFAMALAEYVNSHAEGSATVFVYEDAFGTGDRLHWLFHLSSLDAHEELVATLRSDEDYRDLLVLHAGTDGPWETMFVDGSVRETLLLPQTWGMYGTAEQATDGTGEFRMAAAQAQTSVTPDVVLHTANAGLVIHRTVQPKYRFRAESRMFAREVAESINVALPGEATAFLYEEAFGPADRMHWLIHLRSLNSYYRLIDMHARMTDEIRDIYLKERISPDKGGGTWNRMFVEGSMGDVAFVPLGPDGVDDR